MDRPRGFPGTQAFGLALADGRALVTGFTATVDTTRGLGSQLYDPTTDTWSPNVVVDGNIGVFQIGDVGGLAFLTDGRPLVVYGEQSICTLQTCRHFTQAAVFDAETERWDRTGPLDAGSNVVFRTGLATLPDGRALFLGGTAQLCRPDNTTPRLAAEPMTVDFGRIKAGTVAQRSILLQNTGESELTGTATLAPGTFSIISGSPFNLAPGASAPLVIQFAAGPGSFSGRIDLQSNGDSLSVNLSGTGSASLPRTPERWARDRRR